MTHQEIFEKLFFIAKQSDDTNGVVASCLIRNQKIIAEAVSTNDGVHAEYALLKLLEKIGISAEPEDIVYTTVEPCGKRSPGGQGEKMGDCTSNLIKAGVKNIIYAASDPDASEDTRHKFTKAGVVFKQVADKDIIKKAINLFNSTCQDVSHLLPLP